MSMVLPVVPLCTSSSAPLPRKSWRMRSLAELASIRVANVASLNRRWCLPRNIEFARARGGIFGCCVHKWSTQLLHIHTGLSLSPMPALGGREPAGCAAPLVSGPGSLRWTRRECRSQRMEISSGCNSCADQRGNAIPMASCRIEF